MRSKQAGFTALEVLLVIVVVALIGAAGWYVASRGKQTNASSTAATSSPSQTAASSKEALTVSSTVGGFSFMYPQSWKVTSNVRPDETLSIKSPGEQEDAGGTVSSGATVDVYTKAIDNTSFGDSLSEYMQNYGSQTPTSVKVAGYAGLKLAAAVAGIY
jgi:prepilin-type N-terminal cleavage/methylation domain-containing protein